MVPKSIIVTTHRAFHLFPDSFDYSQHYHEVRPFPDWRHGWELMRQMTTGEIAKRPAPVLLRGVHILRNCKRFWPHLRTSPADIMPWPAPATLRSLRTQPTS